MSNRSNRCRERKSGETQRCSIREYPRSVTPLRLVAALACCALAPTAPADTIHAILGGGYYHHQSGFVFPEKIGDFTLVGVPQDINGTDDVGAYYARVAGGVRTVASVNVYTPDSAEPETRPASVKAKPVTMEISKQPRLRATKVVFKEGKSSRTTLYFIDTGNWIVKVRATTPITDKGSAPVLDTFARSQRWESLQLSPQSCTGSACS